MDQKSATTRSPVVVGIDDIVRRVRQLGVGVSVPYPDTADGASRSGPLAGAALLPE